MLRLHFRHFYHIILLLSLHAQKSICQEIIPLKDIHPGMTGISKTVFAGTNIEEFGIEVLDIIHNYYPHQDLILVRLTGEKVEHTGVVAGMSGSPVYFDGKLAGALAIQFGDFTKEPLAGVTPIEQVFALRDKEKQRALEEIPFHNSSSSYLDLALGLIDKNMEKHYREIIASNNSSRIFQSSQFIPTPIIFSGFATKTIDSISGVLQNIGFAAIPGGSAQSSRYPVEKVPLEPGSAISQVLIDGDMGIDISGTVTWCHGDTILAFGHQVFGAGAIRVPMGQTHILTTIPSIMASNKMAMVTDIIGTMRQDRLPGVIGIVGEQPPMMPIYITCRTIDGEEVTYTFRATTERQLSPHTPFYIRTALINAIVTSRLSGSNFSIKIDGTIVLKNNEDVTLDNFFSGTRTAGLLAPGNDATAAADYVASSLAALMVNQFQEPEIERVQLTFTETAGFSSAEITDVWYNKKSVSPGDTLSLSIKLNRYQIDQPITISKRIPILATSEAQYITVFIGSASQLLQVDRRSSPQKFIPENFPHLVDLLNERRRNDYLHIRISAPHEGLVVGGAELPNLPSSVLTVLNEQRGSPESTMGDHIIYEESMPIDLDLHGSKMIRIEVDK